MGLLFATVGGAPLGLQTGQFTRRVYNRTGGATAVGNLVMFDMAASDGDVSNITFGNENSIFSNVIAPATSGLVHGFFAICLEVAADNAEMSVCIAGRVNALIEGANLAAIGDTLTAVNAQDNLDTDVPVAGQKILGKALAATAAGTAELAEILFDGIYGIGQAVES